jgi:hypothetical protein
MSLRNVGSQTHDTALRPRRLQHCSPLSFLFPSSVLYFFFLIFPYLLCPFSFNYFALSLSLSLCPSQIPSTLSSVHSQFDTGMCAIQALAVFELLNFSGRVC